MKEQDDGIDQLIDPKRERNKQIANSLVAYSVKELIEEDVRQALSDLKHCSDAFGIGRGELDSDDFLTFVDRVEREYLDQSISELTVIHQGDNIFRSAFSRAKNQREKEKLIIATGYIALTVVAAETARKCLSVFDFNGALVNCRAANRLIGTLASLESPIKGHHSIFNFLISSEKANLAKAASEQKYGEERRRVYALWDSGRWKTPPKAAEDIHQEARDEGVPFSVGVQKITEWIRLYKKMKK